MTKKFGPGSENLPIQYEGNSIMVFTNPSKEIFVKDVRTGVTIRINPSRRSGGGLEFTTDHPVVPVLINHMIGWRVGHH